MEWYRELIQDNATQQSVDISSYFFDQKNDGDDSDTPLVDEGTQNSRDSGILEELFKTNNSKLLPISSEDIPIIKISRKKIPIDDYKKFITDNFRKWAKDSEIRDPYFLENFLKQNKEAEVLLFEDFNTKGVQGGPTPHRMYLDKEGKIKNDFFAFLWQVGSRANKGENKGGSVGVGRLTFCFSSKINTFFMYTKQKYDDQKSYFIGMTNFGKSKGEANYDSIARFGIKGKSDQNLEVASPISEEQDLQRIKKIFQIQRDEPGTSMIVPFPEKELTDENLIINTIKRYRIGIYLNHFQISIGEVLINRETIRTVIKKYMPDKFLGYQDYFNFIEECSNHEINKNLTNVHFDDENPSGIKKEDFKKEDFDKIKLDFDGGQSIAIRLPFIIKARIDNGSEVIIEDNKTFVDIFIKKAENLTGKHDVLRGPMSVSGLRKFEDKECFAIVNIQDPIASEFFRNAETPNHKYFDNTNQDFKKKYEKFSHQIRLVIHSPTNLKRIIDESDTLLDSDAAKDFFNFGSGDESSEDSKNKTKQMGSGKSKFQIPDFLFSNPKGYKIEQIKKGNLVGFKIESVNFKEQCKNTIFKINEFLENNNDDKRLSNEIKRKLSKQLERNEDWLKDKNLDELFPSKIFIKIADDLEGKNTSSYTYHDNELDFDLNNSLRHEINVEKKGDITNVELEGNKITITISGPDYSYQILTDALNIDNANDQSDLRVNVKMETYKKKDGNSIKLY